ncbi:unnamed protein product [Malus baccata var. baccata]
MEEEEAIGIHNNKENIPPPPIPSPAATANSKPMPAPGNCRWSSSKKKLCDDKMGLRRKPLADITNLYNDSLPSHLLIIATVAFCSAVYAQNSRKRKAVGVRDEEVQVAAGSFNSKSLRMGFR